MFTKWLSVLLVLTASGCAEDLKNCLIIKHASVSQQFWVSGANWKYVAGEFPPGMKWKSNVTDRYVRKMKESGWKVLTVPEKYSAADLEFAQKQCTPEVK